MELVDGVATELRVRPDVDRGSFRFLDYDAMISRKFGSATNGVLYLISKVLNQK